MKPFKPMLASPITDSSKLSFPNIASPKLDGIRCILDPVLGAVTRNLKPIPNRYIREKLNEYKHLGLDGEIIVGNPTAENVFNVTSSGVMSFDGEPEFVYYVFDCHLSPDSPYNVRSTSYSNIIFPSFIKVLNSSVIKNEEGLLAYEIVRLQEGYEGVMVRDPKGRYKFGRSTEKEGILLKLKRFSDCEVKVVGFEEKLTNTNEATTNELGYTERSSHKDNMIPANTLGSLIVHSEEWGEFNVGSGFNDEVRKEIWNNQKNYLGASVTIKYQSCGVKDKPRFPIFKGFRKDI